MENDLYPELPEEGKKEAEALVGWFKEKLKKAAEEVLSDFYCDTLLYIETDSWANFRNKLMDGLQDYHNNKIHAVYDFKKIRQAILKEHREEIINDLNQDLVEEVADLKKQLEDMRDFCRRR